MNCATHNDTAAVAFCRTCGKALCANCTRDVRGVIYCENCLAARLEGTAPAAGFVPPQTIYPPVGIPAACGPSARGLFRPQPGRRRNSGRLLPLRRGRGLLLAVRQGTLPPRDLRAHDRGLECGPALVRRHGAGHLARPFLLLSDLRRGSNRQSPAVGRTRARSPWSRPEFQYGRQV